MDYLHLDYSPPDPRMKDIHLELKEIAAKHEVVILTPCSPSLADSMLLTPPIKQENLLLVEVSKQRFNKGESKDFEFDFSFDISDQAPSRQTQNVS